MFIYLVFFNLLYIPFTFCSTQEDITAANTLLFFSGYHEDDLETELDLSDTEEIGNPQKSALCVTHDPDFSLRKPAPKKKKQICPSCNQKISRDYYKAHVLGHDPKNYTFECLIKGCNRRFVTRQRRSTHINSVHNLRLTDPQFPNYCKQNDKELI